MDGFVTALPLTPDAAHGSLPDRRARMVAAGWQDTSLPGNAVGLWRGRAGICRAGPWQVIGLAALDNRPEILNAFDDVAPDSTDLGLIAHVLHRMETGVTEALSGGFSFVALHEEDGRALGFRDHFGILPFYYAVRNGTLTCASDIRAALHLSGLPLEMAPVPVGDFLAGEPIEVAPTAFAGLLRLPAAHALTPDGPDVAPRRYWSLSLPDPIPVGAAAEGVRTRLDAATGNALSPAEETGAMLSGGLDSSSLVIFAARNLRESGAPPLPALSFVHDGKSYDERDFIAAVNDMSHTAPHLIEITEAPDLSRMPDLIEEQMDLFLAFGLQKSRRIYHIAREQGLTALIDGHGGDEVISHGYSRVYELAAARRWATLLREIRGISRVYGTSPWEPYFVAMARYGGWPERHPVPRILKRLARLLRPAAPGGAGAPAPVEGPSLLAAALAKRLDAPARYGRDTTPASREDCVDIERRSHLETLEGPMIQNAFEVLYRTANAAGIMPRYPFYNRALVTFCLSMPAEAKMRGGLSRWALREAMHALLPEKVRIRTTKADFTPEFAAAVTGYLRAHPDTSWRAVQEVADLAVLEPLMADIAAGKREDVSALRAAWRAIVLRFWFEAFDRWAALQEEGKLI